MGRGGGMDRAGPPNRASCLDFAGWVVLQCGQRDYVWRLRCCRAALCPEAAPTPHRCAHALPPSSPQDIFYPRSEYQCSIDGAYYGTTFPHLLLMTYPMYR